MSEPNKYREWILETIDSLRSRKARPDLERICRMVRRRHGSDPDRTRTELEKLIQEQTVLKVSYKGSISYRNAAKVQRKSRKKTEFTAAGGGGGGGGAEAARERTKHDHLSSGNNNNNGDSAHSFTDQEEGDGDDSEPSPDPRTPTSACKKPKPASSPGGADVSLGCGATTGCDVGSGCKEEKASAPRDKGLGQQAAGGCPSAAPSHGTGAGDAGRSTADRGDADRDGKEPAPSGADSHNKTCSGSVGALPPQHKPRQAAPLKPKLRVGGGGSRAAGNHANSELGDRLVASVRSVTEKSLRGGSAAAAAAASSTTAAAAAAAAAAIRGHMKPLGLKEILGYLSSQERLSEEKLTRGKVKVVMEREVARGRLRRTRCGNITLPLRGTVPEEPPPPPPSTASADTAGKSAPQDGLNQQPPPPPPAAPQEDEPMETGGAEEEREENEEEEQQQQQQQQEEEEEEEEEDPRSSDEDGGLSPVAMTTEPELVEKPREDAEMQTAPEQESPPRCRGQGVGADLSGASDPVNRAPCPPGQVSSPSLSQCNSGQPEEGRAVAPRQNCGAHSQRDGTGHDSEGFNGLESKTEGVSSSCLLTPTASPRHAGVSEERPVNGEVSGEGCIKCEAASGSPVDWTVADVVSYFTAAGFPEQAAAFRTQEIDGKSLLLMQRNDVLTGLSIRLGPALKIYERHVKVLQRTHFEEDDC